MRDEEESNIVHEVDGHCGGFVGWGLVIRQPCVAVDRVMQGETTAIGLILVDEVGTSGLNRTPQPIFSSWCPFVTGMLG